MVPYIQRQPLSSSRAAFLLNRGKPRPKLKGIVVEAVLL